MFKLNDAFKFKIINEYYNHLNWLKFVAKLLNNKFKTTSSFIKHERPSEEFSNLLKLLIEPEYQMEAYRKISTDNSYFNIADAFNGLKSENKMKNYIIKSDVNYTR